MSKRSPAAARRHAAFVREYLKDQNATQAAARAGYSKKTSYAQGHRLLKDAEIAATIRNTLAQTSEKAGITQERVLRELEALAFSRVNHYRLGSGPDGVELAEGVDPAAWAAISSIKRRVTGGENGGESVELRLWSKDRALELAGKHVGLFKDEPSPAVVVLLPPGMVTATPLERHIALLGAGKAGE